MRGCSGGDVCGCSGGVHGCSRGGMHGCSGGCVVAQGVCMVARGACVVARGACVVAQGGHAWDMTRYGDTVNERVVRILLECILVPFSYFIIRNLQSHKLHFISHTSQLNGSNSMNSTKFEKGKTLLYTDQFILISH